MVNATSTLFPGLPWHSIDPCLSVQKKEDFSYGGISQILLGEPGIHRELQSNTSHFPRHSDPPPEETILSCEVRTRLFKFYGGGI